jgi:maltooligosyltrehalose trehalohydrolase
VSSAHHGTAPGSAPRRAVTAEAAARLGASALPGERCALRVWAPYAHCVEVVLVDDEGDVARSGIARLEPEAAGYHAGLLEAVPPGTAYLFRLDGRKLRPDPASREQRRGVHGPSWVAEPEFPWTDDGWRPPPLADWVLYELHVGTFTDDGTFDGIQPYLAGLRDLGVTAIELMPIAQFPGDRNWGYDGVFPFAAQWSYGGLPALRRLVDACHDTGLAVVLDVVHNHVGPEGNHLADFGPYFTDRRHTPWGPAINFDGPGSDEVRRFFVDSALFWTLDCHVDGLRLDAVQAIVDPSPRPFLEELAERVHAQAERRGRTVLLIAETDANDPRLVRSPAQGGYGMDAHWSDDFHHALHALLTGEDNGYYADFGSAAELGRVFRDGYAYGGRYSRFRGRRQGRDAAGVAAERFVVYAQNHDQAGNHGAGERLPALIDFEGLKLAAAATLLSPFVPLLFMGEEYGEVAPFPFFVSHGDPALVEAVRQGRARDLEAFGWTTRPPDPGSPATFLAARLDRSRARQSTGLALERLYAELLRVRSGLYDRGLPPDELVEAEVADDGRTLLIQARDGHFALLLNFGNSEAEASLPAGHWRCALDTADARWAGPVLNAPVAVHRDGRTWLRAAARSARLLLRDLA